MERLPKILECVREDFCAQMTAHANEVGSLKSELEIMRSENLDISDRLKHHEKTSFMLTENSAQETEAMKLELSKIRHEKAVVSGILVDTSDKLKRCEAAEKNLHTELEHMTHSYTNITERLQTQQAVEENLRAELDRKTHLCGEITERLQTQQVTMNHRIVETGQLVKRHLSEQVENLKLLPFHSVIFQPPFEPLPHPPETGSPPMSPVPMFLPPSHNPGLEFSLEDFGFGPDSFAAPTTTPFYQ